MWLIELENGDEIFSLVATIRSHSLIRSRNWKMCKMEEAREKLAILIKMAKEKNLKSLKIPKKYQKKFQLSLKFKFLFFVTILTFLYGKFSHLLHTQKVKLLYKIY